MTEGTEQETDRLRRVLALTPVGRQELRDPQSGLSLPQRWLLGHLDGESSLEDLAGLPGSPAADRLPRDAARLAGLGLAVDMGEPGPSASSFGPTTAYGEVTLTLPLDGPGGTPPVRPVPGTPVQAEPRRRAPALVLGAALVTVGGAAAYLASRGPDPVAAMPASAAPVHAVAASMASAAPAASRLASIDGPASAASAGPASALTPIQAAAPAPPAAVAAQAAPPAAPSLPALRAAPSEAAALRAPTVAAPVAPARSPLQAAAVSAGPAPGRPEPVPALPVPTQAPTAVVTTAAAPAALPSPPTAQAPALPVVQPPAPQPTAPAPAPVAQPSPVPAPTPAQAPTLTPTPTLTPAPVVAASTAPAGLLRPVTLVEPIFPRDGLGLGSRAVIVQARLVVAPNGTVSQVSFPQSNTTTRVFERAARSALLQWKFPEGAGERVVVQQLRFSEE